MAAVPRRGFVGIQFFFVVWLVLKYHPTATFFPPDCRLALTRLPPLPPPDRENFPTRPGELRLSAHSKITARPRENANPPLEKLRPPGYRPFAKGKKKKGRPQPVAPSIVVLMVEGYAIKKTLLLREKN